jgi:hypothetical protein
MLQKFPDEIACCEYHEGEDQRRIIFELYKSQADCMAR